MQTLHCCGEIDDGEFSCDGQVLKSGRFGDQHGRVMLLVQSTHAYIIPAQIVSSEFGRVNLILPNFYEITCGCTCFQVTWSTIFHTDVVFTSLHLASAWLPDASVLA